MSALEEFIFFEEELNFMGVDIHILEFSFMFYFPCSFSLQQLALIHLAKSLRDGS